MDKEKERERQLSPAIQKKEYRFGKGDSWL